jgi:replicative DNA helicase
MNAQTPIARPASVEVEQSLLGAILMNGEIYARVSDLVTADDFSEDLHRQVFGVMASLSEGGISPGLLAVRPHFGNHALAANMTMHQYLVQLCAATGAGAPLALDYARQVRQLRDRYRIVEIGAEIGLIASSMDAGLTPARIATEAVAMLEPIITAGQAMTARRVTFAESSRSAIDDAMRRANGEPTKSLRTGLLDLDRVIGGLEPGCLSILAGRPGMGKTAVGLQFVLNIAQAGIGVLYFSIEMGADELTRRMLTSAMFDKTSANRDALNYESFLKGSLSDYDFERLEHMRRDQISLPLDIDPQPGLSLARIAVRTRQAKERFAAKGLRLGLVVVDHMGLMQMSSRYKDRVNQMSEISMGLKELAKETETHVTALCQLNRGVESRDNKRPLLSDLRDSGSIEQDADMVFAVYREAYYLKGSDKPEDAIRLLDAENEMELGILKSRQGASKWVRLFAHMGANAIRNAGHG